MRIRVPRAGDAEAMAEVHVLGWRAGCAGILPADYLDALDLGASRSRWRGKLANPAPATDDLVAVLDQTDRGGHDRGDAAPGADGETLVGLASYGRSYDPDLPLTGPVEIGELHLLYVHPDHWGTGAGHRLHEAATAALVQQGFTSGRLWVVRGNTRALRFYTRHGWTRDGPTRTMADGATRWVEERLVRRWAR